MRVWFKRYSGKFQVEKCQQTPGMVNVVAASKSGRIHHVVDLDVRVGESCMYIGPEMAVG